MSWREIRSHTAAEITVMLKALERYHIVRDGQGVTHEMVKQNPLLMETKRRYEEEVFMFRDYRELREKYANKTKSSSVGTEQSTDDKGNV